MTRSIVAALAVCLLSVACGGSDSSGGDDCSKVGDRWHSCDPTSSASEIAAGCRAGSCTGSKQAALDCLLAVEGCDKAAANACLSEQGCPTIP
jgi:hypothetical protein